MVYAAGDESTVIKSADAGVSWISLVKSEPFVDILSIHFVDLDLVRDAATSCKPRSVMKHVFICQKSFWVGCFLRVPSSHLPLNFLEIEPAYLDK